MLSLTKSRLTGKTLFFIFIACFLSSYLYATIINVSAGQSIQAGIAAAANGDTVLVQPGTYVENINYNGKLITVGSLFLTTQDTSYISTTIIDGNSSGSVVFFGNSENSTAVLCGFTITNGLGGGIYCNGASPSLVNLIITNNSTSSNGGGIYCYNSSPSLQNVTITGNSADIGGGIYCHWISSPSLENVTISDNTAGDVGGGIYCYNSNPSLQNVTITGNSSGTYGGGIYCESSSSPVLESSILWDNSPQEIFVSSGSVTATYSDIQGSWAGIGNIDTDPLFVDSSNGDYHLTETSPCIDAGDPASPLDPDGTTADMGAYYFHQDFHPVLHISTTGSDITGNGSEELPFATIQYGINAAINGDIVLVQPGTYIENIYFNGKLITVGSLFLTTQDTTYISSTIIDGSTSGSVVSFEGGEDPSSILTGFTITNGNTNIGGGIYCEEASPSLVNLIITNNSASSSGGGIYCADNSSPSLQNVIIKNNTAEEGGGIYSAWSAGASLENVVITSNSADVYGGGIYCTNTSPVLYNVTISWNSAVYSGGGIYCVDDSNPALENVTIANNTAGTSGGGIYCNFSDPTVTNSILWDDSPDEILIYYSGSVNTTYSDIEGGWSGTGNIDNDPFFVDQLNRDYHLTWANYPVQDATKSSCIDAGDPASPLDPDDTIADMGAYYFPQYNGPIWHISTTGSDITGIGTEQYPFATIQYGIDISANAETVLVQPGTYVENINYNGKLITVASLFLTTQDTTYISQTIIDGNENGSVVIFESGEHSTAVLCGFTITNGLGGGTSPDYYGGGIHCKDSSPSLVNLIITNNSTSSTGGGIRCDNSSPSLENVTTTDNFANYGSGGGISCIDSSPSLNNVTITGNSVGFVGGGIYCDYSNPILENVTFANNSAGTSGGGIYCRNYSNPSLENVTFANNSAGTSGGGIYCESSSSPVLESSILWNNSPVEIHIESGSVTVTYSDIQGEWIGLGNIDSDPLFVDPGNGDYHLQSISPCINTGDPSSPLDPDGTRADMGAYSFNHTIGAPAITAVTDVPSDQGRSVIVTWQRSIWDHELSTIPIVGYNLWEKYPFETDSDVKITNDINQALQREDTYFQREDTTWVLIEYFAAMQWEEYSALAETFFDSTTVGDYLSYFFVSAHTSNPSLYFSSSTASGYSVDNIAPDETDVYIAQNGSNIGLNWDEVEYGTFQGNSYPEINGIWYKIYAGDSPDFVCDEVHLIDTITNLNYDYPLTGEEKKFFKIVVSDQPAAGRISNVFKKPVEPAGGFQKIRR